MHRRALLAAGASIAAAWVARPAWGGSYLTRAALLLSGNGRDAAALRASLTDKEVARVVQVVAEARARAAAKMDVPATVAKAHPHLLLALNHVERAAQGALDGNLKRALEHLEGAKREETVFRAALKEAGHALPARGAS